jgi:hypothetical protein
MGVAVGNVEMTTVCFNPFFLPNYRSLTLTSGTTRCERHVGHQLPCLSSQEGLAERWKSYHQGFHVSPQTSLLDVVIWFLSERIRPICLLKCGRLSLY